MTPTMGLIFELSWGPWSGFQRRVGNRRVERPYLGDAQRLQRPGLGQRSGWRTPASPGELRHRPGAHTVSVGGPPRPRSRYVSRRLNPSGVQIIDLRDPTKANLLYTWWIDDPDLHRGGGMDNKYFKLRNRYYDVQSFQFQAGTPDAEVGAIVFDVSGLPDTTTIREIGRIREPASPGGFHNIFAYRHSDGRALLFATVSGAHANVYDMERFVGGDHNGALIARIPNPNPDSRIALGYHDFYVGYDPATRQDKFYGAGLTAYLVYDVTRPEEPELLTTITGVAGLDLAHTFTPTPDGRYVIAEMEYQYAPLRIFDLKPGLDGEVQTISRPIGAWTADWKGLPHNHEVRWPYVFVSHYEDGLQIFDMMDPTKPYTVGYYDSYDGPTKIGACGDSICNGAFGVDVRNADGLIVISDMTTGFWSFKMDGFDGWNGHQWGMPNVSSAQDWDNGPDGAPAPARVSRR